MDHLHLNFTLITPIKLKPDKQIFDSYFHLKIIM
jgi:hypothetical protein